MNRMNAPVSLLLTFVSCGFAFGLGGEHPVGQPVGGSSEWPLGLKELANSEGRMLGFFVNANDYFYYAGDTKALNTFLERYAKLKDMPLKVTLHVGRKEASTPWPARDGRKPAAYQWTLTSMRRGWGAPEDPSALSKYVVTVDVQLDGVIELDELKVPENVSVESGGEIEKFIARHQALPLDKSPAAEKVDRD